MKCPKCQADNADEAVCCSLCYETFKPKTKSASSADGGSGGGSQPSDAQGWYQRGCALVLEMDEDDEEEGLVAEKSAQALAALDKALALEPTHVEAWFCKGRVLADHSTRPEESIPCFAQALALDPRHAAAWLFRGMTLAKTQCDWKAFLCFEFARQVGHPQAEGLMELHRQIVTAAGSPVPGGASEPSDCDGWFQLGSRFQDSKQPREALRCYERCVMMDSRHAAAWIGIGMLVISPERSAEAFECFELARLIGHPEAAGIADHYRKLIGSSM